MVALKTQQHKNFSALAHEYIDTHKKFNDQYRNEIGIIDATFKIKDTFLITAQKSGKSLIDTL